MGRNEYTSRKSDIELFLSARRGNEEAEKVITVRGNGLADGILPRRELLGDVWEILYSRSPDDVSADITNKGFNRVFKEIAKCVAAKYNRDWDNGMGAIYGRSKDSRLVSIRDDSLYKRYKYLINR